MRCPQCNKYVDPETDGTWWTVLEEGTKTAKDVLLAIRKWDESARNCGGQSVLPTELRDAVRIHTNYYEQKIRQ